MQKLAPILALMAFAACQPKPAKNTGTADSTQVNEAAADVHGISGMPNRFYKQFKGTIAGQPVTLQLIRAGDNNISGYYVYDKVGEPIRLYSQQDTSYSLVLLEEDFSGESKKKLAGKLDNGAYTGNWTDGTKLYPFSLKEDNNGIIELKLIVLEDTARLRPSDPESASATSLVQVLWPVGGAPEQTLQMIRDTITKLEKGRFTDGETYAKAIVGSFAASSMEGLKEMDTIRDMGSAMKSWSSQQVTDVVWNKYPYLVLENMYWEYTGGAHGNGGSMFTFFDLAKNKTLTPADVFKPGYEAAVGKALEKALRKKYDIPANEGLDNVLFGKTIAPNDNFYMTDKYVVFSYTPYEIAAYAVGQITLAVPLSEISTVLK
ncbi:RsiV family protein [Chitinophaga horti]|uniref:RsiV family protein n=1 Tax=Chitinophaga horti TaxID=2920382 RepID=A0ABY6J3U1_9BACT|nr:RsiV family protein [Chitinophaga horti]UYQ92969.1 RsiV family protein [Chitinophaga horti]